MDKLEAFQEASVEWIKKAIDYIKLHWKAFLLGGLAIVFVILLTVIIIPNTQKNIRTKEVEALVTRDVKNVKQVKIVPVNGLDKIIRKENNVAVGLVDPNDDNYDSLIKTLNDESKMSQFVGENDIYLYPIVYDKKKTTDFYKLEAGLTFIYFENQTEVERTELIEQKEIDLYLVDHLNSLSRGTVVKKKEKSAEAEKTEKEKTAETAESTTESEEIIDELQ